MNKPKKPTFKQQNSHRIKSLNPKRWRRPKGLHSKIRLHKRGNAKEPSQGYRSPKAIRFQHPTGVTPIVVSSLSDLSSITQGAIIVARTVGRKKRMEIVAKATTMKLTILNLPDDYVARSEKLLADRKKKRSEVTKKRIVVDEKETKKEEKKTKPKKKAAKKEAPAEAKEKKKEAQKEQEKVITKGK